MSLDLTELGPARLCPCGCNVFKILVSWTDANEIAGYDRFQYCDSCGNRLEAPMPGVNC